jgi:hypothetical protein
MYSHLFFTQQVTRGVGAPDSINQKGHIAVMANQLSGYADLLVKARHELAHTADPMVVNGLISAAIQGFQSIHDHIASYCHRHYPDIHYTSDKLYFHEYSFEPLDVNFIIVVRDYMYRLKFKGNTFKDLANECKHNFPWLGQPSSLSHGRWDIYDGRFGLLQNMIGPVYSKTKHMLETLGGKIGVSSMQFPTL